MEGAAPGCNPVVSPALVSAGQEPRSRLRGGSRLGLERLRVLKGESFLNEQKKAQTMMLRGRRRGRVSESESETALSGRRKIFPLSLAAAPERPQGADCARRPYKTRKSSHIFHSLFSLKQKNNNSKRARSRRGGARAIRLLLPLRPPLLLLLPRARAVRARTAVGRAAAT